MPKKTKKAIKRAVKRTIPLRIVDIAGSDVSCLSVDGERIEGLCGKLAVLKAKILKEADENVEFYKTENGQRLQVNRKTV